VDRGWARGWLLVLFTGCFMAAASLPAETFTRLQLLLPGEVAAPGSGSGKTGTPYVQVTNTPFTVTVRAVDANWNLISTNDVVRITASGGNASLPADAALVNGTGSFNVTLATPGFATITAANLTQPAITANQSPEFLVTVQQTPSLIYNFTYANRLALLAAGWDFLARTANNGVRNTEITNAGNGALISYNQTTHPGVLQLPAGSGDLWENLNDSRNSLFRNLPTNWTSLQLDLSFAPNWPYQQVNLALYQDDDHYVEVGVTHNHTVSLVQEVGGVGNGLTALPVLGTDVQLRLDRDVNYGDVSAFYSYDGTNWVYAGRTAHELVNPRLGIWAGASLNGAPYVDLRQLRIATSAAPFVSTLALQPLALVFNSVVGVANTNVQRVNLYRRGPDGFKWSVTKNASWLSVSATSGSLPGFCDISVNTAGLTNGLYQATLSFTAAGAVTNITTVPVTMIVNANTRAKVATWKGGKRAAMSVWIDDSDLVMFNELTNAGFAGTYALMGPGPQSFILTSYHNAGMELGSHTHNHPCFPLDEPGRRAQLENNIADIITSTPQTPNRLVSFAWPCGANTTREKVWAYDYFLISRGYNINQLEDPSPKDWMNVKSYNSHEHPPAPPADLKTTVDAAISQGKWVNLVFHQFNNDDGAVAYAVGKDIWVGTGGDVTRYIMQRDRTVISNYVQAAGQISFDCYRLGIPASNLRSFETAFNPNDTVTFQIAVTNLPPVVGVTVGGAPRPFSIRTGGGTTNLFFDTLVSGTVQPVVITLSSVPVLTVTADNKTKVYRQPNPALTGTLTGVQAGDNITATYATAATTTSAVGTYPITPVLNDPNGVLGNYTVITNLGTLTITKSNAPITLGSLNQGYNGSARSATATTVPSGLAVNFTYNGATAAPTNAGSYQVIGTINEANYAGAATNTLTITKSNAPLTLGNLTQVFNGSGRSATATTVPSGLTVNFTYNGATAAPTNAGSYQVIGTIVHTNYAGAATNTLTITKSNAPVTLGNLAQVFTGSARSASAATVPSGLSVTFTYGGQGAAPTNAGSYQVIATVVHTNYAGAATNTLTVAKSNAPVSLGNLNAVYDGAGHAVTVTTVPPGLNVTLTYDGSSLLPTNAGSYQVIGTINETNYAGAATNTLTIAKANAPVTLGNLTQGFDGTARMVTVTTEPSELTVNVMYAGNAEAPTNAGSYEVIGTIVALNYAGAVTNTLTVTPASAIVTLDSLSQTYDGTARVVTANTVPEDLIVVLTYNGSTAAPTNAGSYQVIGIINEANYAGAATNTLTVTKSNAPITLGNLSAVYSGSSHAASATTVPPGLHVVLSYARNGNAPTNAGSYQVIGTIVETNYLGNATNTLVIAPHPLSVVGASASRMFGEGNPVFTGSLTGVQSGDVIAASYSTTATASSPIGNYDIVPTLLDPNNRLENYTLTVTNGLLTIVGAPRFTSIARTALGSVHLVCDVYVGRTYVFQFKNTLAEAEWTSFALDYTAVSPSVEVWDTPGDNPQRFYRAVDVTSP
jgi:hypothetical protein